MKSMEGLELNWLQAMGERDEQLLGCRPKMPFSEPSPAHAAFESALLETALPTQAAQMCQLNQSRIRAARSG